MAGSDMSPARRLISITPDDNNDLPGNVVAIYCNKAGTIAVVAKDDQVSSVQIFTVVATQTLDIQPKRIMATGTTLTGIIGMCC